MSTGTSNGSPGAGPRVSRLGHVGLYCRDLAKMRDWYRDTLGLTVADEAIDGIGIVFLTSRPDEEHHELALAKGRETDDDVPMVQQVSWKVDSIEEVQAFHRLFKERNIPVQYEVTHGNAVSIYFYDPEGNRNEVYYSVKADVRQPFRKSINLEQPPEQVLAENRRLIEQGGGRPT